MPDRAPTGAPRGAAGARAPGAGKEGCLGPKRGQQRGCVGAEGGLDGHPTLAAYVARATARPAFRRAHEDHMAHWRDADAARKQSVA